MRLLNKLIIPNATAFVVSFCIMVVELIAGRIVARYLGMSLYTWTAVIGIVLAGIALGNYIGGRLADRFQSKKILSFIFAFAAVSCITVPVFNKLAGEFYLFWLLSWPVRTILHVGCVFFIPSVLLGMVFPAVAKFALDKGFKTGWTIGSVYAWSAAGSIVGTFSTGFFLIPTIGTLSVVWLVAGILAVMSILYAYSRRLFFFWIGILVIIGILSLGPQTWVCALGKQLGFRKDIDSSVIYQKESQYSYIKVKQSENLPNVRKLILDQLLHSIVDIEDPTNIEAFYQYSYITLYGAITRCVAADKKRLRVLAMGGGGYVFPRYIEEIWPGSNIEVVEIDRAVTKAAVETLGLSKDSSINIHHMDARGYIDKILWQKRNHKTNKLFDFVYGDAVSGFSVPYQLTTYEFNEKIRQLLAPEGVYIITVIDSLHLGRFLGAVINTFRKSFPFVYAFSGGRAIDPDYAHNTFIVMGSMQPVDFSGINIRDIDGSQLEESQLKMLEKRSGGIVLTDDYAPVDNLLAPVAHQQGIFLACSKLMGKGNGLLFQDKFNEAVKWYKKSLEIAPNFITAYDNIGIALARQGKLEEAVGYYKKALEKNPNLPLTHNNLGNVFRRQERFTEAIESYKRALQINPYAPEVYSNLGNVFVRLGKIEQAIEFYREGLTMGFNHPEIYNNLGNAFAFKGNLIEAVKNYKKALEVKPGFEQAQYNLEAVAKEIERRKKSSEDMIHRTE